MSRLPYLLLALALTGTCKGEIHAYHSIEGLLDLADVVAAGLLIQVRQEPGSTSGSLTLTAPTYIRGNGPEFALVAHYDDVRKANVEDLVGLLGARTLLFLSTDSQGTMHLISPESGGIISLKDAFLSAKSASPPQVLEPHENDSTIQKLIKELVSFRASAPDWRATYWLTGLGALGVEAGTFELDTSLGLPSTPTQPRRQ